MTTFGVDGSTPLKAADLKARGAEFAVFRCIREINELDETFKRNVEKAVEAGQIPGGYDFLRTNDEAVLHARMYVDATKKFIREGPFLVMLDLEASSRDANGDRFHKNPTWKGALAWAKEFRRTFPRHPILVYANQGYWHDTVEPPRDAMEQLEPAAFWLAYFPRPVDDLEKGLTLKEVYKRAGGNDAEMWELRIRGGFKRATFWQYKGTYKLGDDRVDMNAFQGSVAELLTFATSTAAPVITPPSPDRAPFEGVDMTITRVKGEDWRPNMGSPDAGVLRERPDTNAPEVAKLPDSTVVRTIAEVKGNDGGSWRLTERNGKVAFLRFRDEDHVGGDWLPVTEGGDAAVDANLDAYIARTP